jgi:DNA-binding CsgD family transcriptional regulator
MSRKRFSVEQIINHLREAEILVAQGKTVGEICRRIGLSE